MKIKCPYCGDIIGKIVFEPFDKKIKTGRFLYGDERDIPEDCDGGIAVAEQGDGWYRVHISVNDGSIFDLMSAKPEVQWVSPSKAKGRKKKDKDWRCKVMMERHYI